jgi:hypothetical protein
MLQRQVARSTGSDLKRENLEAKTTGTSCPVFSDIAVCGTHESGVRFATWRAS